MCLKVVACFADLTVASLFLAPLYFGQWRMNTDPENIIGGKDSLQLGPPGGFLDNVLHK